MSQPSPHADLLSALSSWSPVPREACAGLIQAFTPWSCHAGEQVAKPGETLGRVLFVSTGLLRFYTLDEEGREWNKGFIFEGGITGPLSGDALHWPSPHGLQALEEAQGLHASIEDFRLLCTQHRGLDDGVRRLLAKQLEHKAARLESLQRLDATARYREFLRESPALAQRLPQYHVASYLGVTEVTLSRIRTQLMD